MKPEQLLYAKTHEWVAVEPDSSGGKSRLSPSSVAKAAASIALRSSALRRTFQTNVGNIGITSDVSIHGAASLIMATLARFVWFSPLRGI